METFSVPHPLHVLTAGNVVKTSASFAPPTIKAVDLLIDSQISVSLLTEVRVTHLCRVRKELGK